MQLPLIDRFSRYVGQTVCWLFLVAVIISVFEVVSDWVFDAPTIWEHDLTITLCSTCFLLGGAFAMQRQEHIRITVLYDFFWCESETAAGHREPDTCTLLHPAADVFRHHGCQRKHRPH